MELRISEHAINRFIERVYSLNPEDYKKGCLKRIVIKAKLNAVNKIFLNKDGNYKVEDHIYATIIDNVIVTVIKNEKLGSLFIGFISKREYKKKEKVIGRIKSKYSSYKKRSNKAGVSKQKAILFNGNENSNSKNRVEELLKQIKDENKR